MDKKEMICILKKELSLLYKETRGITGFQSIELWAKINSVKTKLEVLIYG